MIASCRLGCVTAAIVCAVGCCPIPMRNTYLVEPDLVVTVVDVAGGPVVGAEVLVVREKVPHGGVTGQWRLVTDSSGVATMSPVTQVERVMPLMMHGVHEYQFSWCASAPGQGAVADSLWQPIGGPFRVIATLPGGTGACAVVHDEARATP